MTKKFNAGDLKKLYIPLPNSQKGDNGKVLIIAGSALFHSASIWPLEVASRIVDMVFYSSNSTNNKIVQNDKNRFRNGIVIPREEVEKYIEEADCTLIGPGLPRDEGLEQNEIKTKDLTYKLLKKYPKKKWVIDGGSLQVIEPSHLPKTAIVTPNRKEFEMLFNMAPNPQNVFEMAKKYQVTILSKGEKDYISNPANIIEVWGGNQGMTKGGTGDVLAGLTASLYCKNPAFLAASCASFINKKAGESLYKTRGLYFNASDLALEIPVVMKNLLTS